MEKGSSSKNSRLGVCKGRRKIVMKKIAKPDDLLISFSKRRSGMYKKASELAVLCGAEVGIVIFSPSGKPYSYGYPTVHDVTDKFMADTPTPTFSNPATGQIVEAHHRRHLASLSDRQENLLNELDGLRTSSGTVQGDGGPAWWEADLEGVPPSELKDQRCMLAAVHSVVTELGMAEPGAGDGFSCDFGFDY